ncbi:poly-beta-hydroxybutyrate polymerase [Pseudonocardia sp. TMWB2A]|uniref:PHA/PHB synthase family protein n=1 Tax=Pseudonocardia sp. TMWB2A TaxID=687430 RepID=UPI00307E8589
MTAAASVGRRGAVALPPWRDVVGGAGHLVAQVGPLASGVVALGGELTRVVRGTCELAPGARDRRFADPAWVDSPLYRRVAQTYLAVDAVLGGLLRGVETSGASWRTIERARLARSVIGSTLAPTNTLPGNPAALRRAVETGGGSLLRGARNVVADVLHNGAMPSQVDARPFVVGRDTAISPGAVVARDEVAELIQYTPMTARVRRRPLVVVPPPIGRYYFLDLRPGRSFVEFALSHGHPVFMISWRNPGPDQADLGVDDYAARVVSAYETAAAVSGSDDVDTLAFCAGGILTTATLAHLAHIGRADLVRSAALAVTLLDFDVPAPIGAFSSPSLLAIAAARSSVEGVISARSLGAVFSWMRPDDLVWSYVVNNYLMGQDPPAFDILAWNADGTNLPARLHREFLEVFGENRLVRPGAVTVLGSPVDLGAVGQPVFVTGARTDHLTPWSGCYRTTQHLGGEATFALSSSGHVASLVNPPGNPRSSFSMGPAEGTAAEWDAAHSARTGSWWEGWAEWVSTTSPSAERRAPRALGDDLHPALDPAPGRYVRDLTA